MVGPPGRRSVLFVFVDLMAWLMTVVAEFFVDGTFDIIPIMEVYNSN